MLKKIQAEWYQKLRDEGFEDIEDNFQFHSRYFLGSHTVITQKEVYFQRAETFLNDFEFYSQLDKDVWTLHCKGDSMREIGKELKISHSKAQRIIDRLKEIMMGAIL